jgi:hypothetical protein
LTPVSRALLAGAIDYAGMFPPAALSLTEAVRRYDGYRRSPRAWLLGRFVAPASRLGVLSEAAKACAAFPERLPVSATVLNFDADVRALDTANEEHLQCDAIEAKADSPADVDTLAACAGGRTAYVEVGVRNDPSALIDAIARRGLCAKIRTGGTSADAFPTPVEVVRFMQACTSRGVVYKATAGLHHLMHGVYPLTYERNAVRGTMFGFLNVFVAAALARAGNAEAAVEVLTVEDRTAFTFSAGGIAWRDVRVSAGDIGALRRNGLVSFGSCSFEEPVQELAEAGMAA